MDGWVDRKRERETQRLNHLSVHQFVLPCMNRSNSPLSLKLPPPRCAVLLVNITAGMKLAYAFSMSDLCSIPVLKTLAESRSLNIRFIGSKTMLHDRSPYYMLVVGAICRDFKDFPVTPSSKSSVMAPSQRHC